MRLVVAFVAVSLVGTAQTAPCAQKEVFSPPAEDNRAGAVLFVDECLTRGLTNTLSINALRSWATNTIHLYQSERRGRRILDSDVPDSIKSIQSRIPACRLTWITSKVSDSPEFAAACAARNVTAEEVFDRWFTISPDPDPPHVAFFTYGADDVAAIQISWMMYGIIVGPESFSPSQEWKPWYLRKLADGVFLFHGYK